MKSFTTVCMLSLFLTVGLFAQQKPKLQTHQDTISYIIGVQIAKNIKLQGLPVNPEFVLLGCEDGFDGHKLLFTEDQIGNVMAAFQQEMLEKESGDRVAKAESNKKEGEAFFLENKKKDSVVTLPSGLQYKILVEGKGKKPRLTDTVIAHYRGTLLDGTEFDNSYRRGEPLTIPVKGVIPGWSQALQLMKVGSKWRLFIPSSLGYGERGAGQLIGPNQALIFDVELLSIK